MTPSEQSYDLPRLKEMTRTLRELLDGAAHGIADPAQRREVAELSQSFQRIIQEFETEQGKLDTDIESKLALARQKMDQAQAAMRTAEEKAKQLEVPAVPDWSLGPKLRDELLARRAITPPPALKPGESLAPWVFSAEPAPPPPSQAPPVHHAQASTPPPPAQSMASWLVESPPVPDQPAAPPGNPMGHGSIVSWMFSADTEAADPKQEGEWKESMKQWLARSRKPSPEK